MIEEIKYKEVEITTPEFVEHFMLLQRDKDANLHGRWRCINFDANIELINNHLQKSKQYSAKFDRTNRYEYKILSIKLPA